MLNIGAGEIALIMVVALLVLGPKRLPELARGIGKFLREFRRQTDDVRSMVEREFYKMDQDVLPESPPPAEAPGAITHAPLGDLPPAEPDDASLPSQSSVTREYAESSLDAQSLIEGGITPTHASAPDEEATLIEPEKGAGKVRSS